MSMSRNRSSLSSDPVSCAASNCSTPIGSADYSLNCELCGCDFHHRCVNFTDVAFNSFTRLNSASLVSFYCGPCKDKINSLRDTQASNSGDEQGEEGDRLSKVEKQLENITHTLDVLCGKITPEPSPTPSQQSDHRPKSYAAAASKGVDFQARVVTVSDFRQIREEEAQKRSLVIAGLPETGNDFETVSALCRYLDPCANVSDVFRMGRIPKDSVPTRPRLLKVHVPSSSVVKSVLGVASKLKDSKHYKGVYIRRSMTLEERGKLATLRERCKHLNETKTNETLKYVVLNERLVRFKGCVMEDGRLQGGTKNKEWIDDPLN